MSGTSVSVVVPVLDDPRVFALVESVLACRDEAGEFELLVVDNGSPPEFATTLRDRLPKEGVTLLVEPEQGVYRARNRAVDAARGELVFFTDADCVVAKGWLAAGIAAAAAGADLIQGFSGSSGKGPIHALLQQRYEAHLRKLRPGDATECDTRNLAVRAKVFEKIRFNDRFRRVGDTEFGLVAEAAGFRVAYEPKMRLEHDHDPDLRLFAAKQACHGWGAQRLMQDHPEVEWHGGHLKLVARLSQGLGPRWITRVLSAACIRGALLNASLLQRLAPRLPHGIGFAWLTGIDKLAALGGHLSYRPGAAEPSPSGILGRQLARN